MILADYVRKITIVTCNNGMGVLLHQKTGMCPKERSTLRPNFDTLYSYAVLDLNTCRCGVARHRSLSDPRGRGRIALDPGGE